MTDNKLYSAYEYIEKVIHLPDILIVEFIYYSWLSHSICKQKLRPSVPNDIELGYTTINYHHLCNMSEYIFKRFYI